MTDAEFQIALTALTTAEFGEDFEQARYVLYQDADASQRACIRELHQDGKLQPPTRWKNAWPPLKADVQNVDQLRQFMLPFLMKEFSKDWREDLLGIAWCYNTACLFGLNADRLLKEFALLASPHMEELIREFLERSDQEKSLKAWCFIIVQGQLGPYVQLRP